ncbi:MAG: hypothetical protein ABSB58_00765 [Gemmatimonadales bacterium]|jgi:hypothetical protein
MNRDFVEMLAALSAAGVEFLVVGAYALAVHGRPRATGDLDIWVRPTRENAQRVLAALRSFGAPVHDLTLDELSSVDLVYQIGVAPARIDLLTGLTAVTFEEAWPARTTLTLDGLEVPVIGRDALLRNKRALGRPRDLADVADLEGGGEPQGPVAP